MIYEPLLDCSGVLQYCPTSEELQLRHDSCKPFVDCFLGTLNATINSCEKITISEKSFPSIEIFSAVMNAVGQYFATVEHIEVSYEKPEDKNKASATYGEVFPKIIIKNKNLIKEKEDLKFRISELRTENQKLNKSIQTLISKKD